MIGALVDTGVAPRAEDRDGSVEGVAAVEKDGGAVIEGAGARATIRRQTRSPRTEFTYASVRTCTIMRWAHFRCDALEQREPLCRGCSSAFRKHSVRGPSREW